MKVNQTTNSVSFTEFLDRGVSEFSIFSYRKLLWSKDISMIKVNWEYYHWPLQSTENYIYIKIFLFVNAVTFYFILTRTLYRYPFRIITNIPLAQSYVIYLIYDFCLYKNIIFYNKLEFKGGTKRLSYLLLKVCFYIHNNCRFYWITNKLNQF